MIEITDHQDINGNELYPSVFIQDMTKKITEQECNAILARGREYYSQTKTIVTSLNGQTVIEKISNIQFFN